MQVGSEGWPVWSDPTDQLLELRLLKQLLLVLIERSQNTQSWRFVVCGTSQGAHADPCPLLEAPTMDV